MLKVLNLYAGIGGNRKLWKDVNVTAVEINPNIAKVYQEFFQDDKVIVGDAHEYLLEHFGEFDFIWSSPPCQSHSGTNHFLFGQGIRRYPGCCKKLSWQFCIGKSVLANFYNRVEVLLVCHPHYLGSYVSTKTMRFFDGGGF